MNRGLKQKQYLLYLTYFTVFICYLVICLFGFFYHMERQIQQTIHSSLVSTAGWQSENINTMLEQQFHALQSLASYVGTVDDIASKDTLVMLEQFASEGSFKYVQAVDVSGTMYRLNDSPVNISDREYFQRALAGESAVSNPVESRIDGGGRIVLAVPVKDGSGTVQGVLAASFDVASLITSLSSPVYDSTGFSFVCDSTGAIIVQNEQQLIKSDNFFDYLLEHPDDIDVPPGEVKEAFASLKEDSIRVTYQNTSYRIAYIPLDINDWLLCYAVPEHSLLEEYQFIRTSEIAFGCTVLVGILALLLALTQAMRKERRELLTQAQIDTLTGLKNRSALQSEITMLLTRTKAASLFHAFVICDIDDFKFINDTWGHTVGDQVLVEFGKLLRRTFRNTDIVGRLGGDEFVIFLCRVTDRETAQKVASKFSRKLEALQIPDYPEIHIKTSMGIAFSPLDDKDFATLYRHADQALYASKNTGKGRITLYTDNLKDGQNQTFGK